MALTPGPQPQARLFLLGNCTPIAREASTGPEPIRRSHRTVVLTWSFLLGTGDGNRTRTISLGICAIRAVVRPDLRRGVSASDRDRPSGPVANGPLMARRPSPHCAPTLIVGQGRGADRFVNALR